MGNEFDSIQLYPSARNDLTSRGIVGDSSEGGSLNLRMLAEDLLGCWLDFLQATTLEAKVGHWFCAGG